MRDVTWRPPQTKAVPNKRIRQACLLGGLLSVNVAVVLYHGDPLDGVVPNKSEAPVVDAIVPLEPAALDTEAGVAAVLDVPQPEYDPTLALRSPGPVHRVEVIELRRNQNAAGALVAAGIDGDMVAGALASLTDIVDFRRLRPGHSFKVRLDQAGTLLSLDVIRGPSEQARAERVGDEWRGEELDIPIDTLVAEVSGVVEDCLWNAMVTDIGERAQLVHDVVDVFAWEIDFYSQVFPGDTFKLLVEKRYAGGEFVGYGNLLAAELVSDGAYHRGFIHQPPTGADGKIPPFTYYDAEGKSMRKQLLKAPLKYGAVTSGFGRRRHPILGYTRAHNGIDYGVPSGTPVWSVGDGRVMRAGWNGGYGRYVAIRHANGWFSEYAHLSKINVKAGQRVLQKENIGAVGNTGLSTGSHLHYGLKRQGKFVNPVTQKFDPGKSLKGAELEAFKRRVADLAARLEGMTILAMMDNGG